jgi:TP901 family phage tail tape measure protein
MGMLHIRLGLVGADLEKATMQFSTFADVTDQDVAGAVTDVTKLMAQWNIPASELSITLDKITLSSQLTGEKAKQLTQTLSQAGPIFQSAGISIDQAAGMLIGFSKAGIDAQTATSAINIALRKFAQEGVKDSGAALSSLIEEIQNTSDKSRATTLAVENFGKSGITMATAIRSGALDVKEWTAKIAEAKGALEKTDAATESFSDVTDKLGNQLQGLLAESFQSVLEVIKPFLKILSEAVAAFEALPGPVKKIVEVLALVVGGLQVAKVAIAAFGITANASLGPIILALTAIVALATQIPSLLNEASKSVDIDTAKRYGAAWFDASKSLKENQTQFDILRTKYQEFKRVADMLEKKQTKQGFLDPEDINRLRQAQEGVEALADAGKRYGELLKKQSQLQKESAKAGEVKTQENTDQLHTLTAAEKKAAEEAQSIEREKNKKLAALGKQRYEDTMQVVQQGNSYEFAMAEKLYENQAELAAKQQALWTESINAVSQTVSTAYTATSGTFSSVSKLINTVSINVKNGVKDIGAFVSDLAGQIAGSVNSIFGAIQKGYQQTLQTQQSAIDKEIAANKKALTKEQADIDKATKAKLKALGLEEKTTLEKDQAELESAIATGDAIAIKAAEDQLAKDTILQQGVDAKQAAADREAETTEDLERKKSDLAYKSAHAQWELQGVQLAAASALAIMQLWAGSGTYVEKIVMSAVVGAIGIAEGVILANNEPKRSSYAVGTYNSIGGAANLAEQGPELVISPSVHNLAKGSTVLNAAQTAKAMSGKGSTINVNVGHATQGTVGEIARAINSESRKLAFAGVL